MSDVTRIWESARAAAEALRSPELMLSVPKISIYLESEKDLRALAVLAGTEVEDGESLHAASDGTYFRSLWVDARVAGVTITFLGRRNLRIVADNEEAANVSR